MIWYTIHKKLGDFVTGEMENMWKDRFKLVKRKLASTIVFLLNGPLPYIHISIIDFLQASYPGISRKLSLLTTMTIDMNISVPRTVIFFNNEDCPIMTVWGS